MAPRKAFQPLATGGECSRVRSRDWRPRGPRRVWMAVRMEAVVGEVAVGGLGV